MFIYLGEIECLDKKCTDDRVAHVAGTVTFMYDASVPFCCDHEAVVSEILSRLSSELNSSNELPCDMKLSDGSITLKVQGVSDG